MGQESSARDLPWKEVNTVDPYTIASLAEYAGLVIGSEQQPAVAAMLSYLTADVAALDDYLDQRQRPRGENWSPIW